MMAGTSLVPPGARAVPTPDADLPSLGRGDDPTTQGSPRRGMDDSHQATEEPDAGKRARPVVRPGKAGVFSRSQSCRGKNRKPRSWEGRPEGNRRSWSPSTTLPVG